MDDTDSRFLSTLSGERDSDLRVDDAHAILHVVYPGDALARWTLSGESVVLGRNPPNDVWRLRSRRVSRQHVAISSCASESGPDAAHRITDLGSHNGTWLNGVRLQSESRRLDRGDVIRVGDIVMVYERGSRIEASAQELEAAIPGASLATRRLRSDIARVAGDPSPVLLIGETGAGKEYIADAVHRLSGRSGPLVAVNCATLGAQVIESELFGHVRGAFTGATAARRGLFQSASGGTLLLDEIGELPLELQPTLLRAIQEGEVRPVGSNRTEPVNTRLLAATNRDLAALVDRGEFRRDLYARLALWEIRVPALRQRRADILYWVHRFHAAWLAARDALPEASDQALRVSAELAERLLLHAWPMNLRGVQRVVHHLASLGQTGRALTTYDLPDSMRAVAGDSPAQSPGQDGSERAEREKPASQQADTATRPPAPRSADELQQALARCGSVAATARYYGRDRRQIYRWMDAFGLRDPS